MATSALPSDATLVRYLLGVLPQDEEERLDERSIVDAQLSERVRSIEHDLTDAYIRGELSGADRQQWERRYLASPLGRQQVDLARALAARERRVAQPRQWRTFTWGVAAAAVVVFAAALSAYVVIHRRGSVPPPRATVAAASHTEPLPAPRPPSTTSAPRPPERRFVAMTLLPSTRSLAQTPTLTIPKGTEDVRLTLKLEPNDSDSYTITVRDLTSSAAVWKSGAVDAISTRDGATITLVIAARVFHARRYLINVTGVSTRGTEIIGGYPIRIVLE